MRVLGLVLASGLIGCAGAPTAPAVDASVGADLLVWDGQSMATVWVRDDVVIARRPEVIVAADNALHALRFLPRKAIAHWRGCSDGCPVEGCDYVAPPDPRPPREELIDELFDVPLSGGPSRLLATPTTQEDVTCGVAGSHPSVTGGIEARVSIAWSEGETSSGAPGTFESPRGAVVDLATGELVPLATPPGFEDKARALLLACDASAEDDCYRLEGASVSGPIALQMTPYEWSEGVTDVGLSALAALDVWGVDYDATKWLEVEDTLGLGPIPAEAIHIAARTWSGTRAFGFSHVAGTRAQRDTALALFRSAPIP